MRTITLLVVHCTATPAGRPVGRDTVDSWHRQRGWSGIGYHYLVSLDGIVETGREEARVGAHCQHHNAHSIGICYVGGTDREGRPADTRTEAQRLAADGPRAVGLDAAADWPPSGLGEKEIKRTKKPIKEAK